jgi:hypothetical protein
MEHSIKDKQMVDLMLYQDGSDHWNIIFTRPIHDWEVELVSSFFEMLYSLGVKQGDVDRICWIPSKRYKFEVKTFYHVLNHIYWFPVSVKEYLEI